MTLEAFLAEWGVAALVFLLALSAMLAGAGAFGFGAKSGRRGGSWRRRRFPRDQERWAGAIPKPFPAPADRPFDAAEQLRCVTGAAFTKRRLLNRQEARLLAVVERSVAAEALPWRVMAQVALGEILSSPDERAYRAINSKRVDILIVKRDGEPVAALEYQGAGHHQANAAVRDAVKKEALRRAGIFYAEVVPGDEPDDIRRLIAKLGVADRAPA